MCIEIYKRLLLSLYAVNIITQVIIEIRAIARSHWLRMASYSAIITSAEVIIAAAPRFVDVPKEEINLMKENAIKRNTKHATKFGLTFFKGKM